MLTLEDRLEIARKMLRPRTSEVQRLETKPYVQTVRSPGRYVLVGEQVPEHSS